MKLKKIVVLMACSFPLLSHALTTDDFEFESGANAANYTRKGKPKNVYMVPASELPSATLSNVYSMLPEGSYVNSDFIAPNRLSNIHIDKDLNGFATASVTFLNEGAGYRNALGYFVYDTDNPPATIDDIDKHTIIFPNASKPPQGNMQEGQTLDLDVELRAGQSLGFFIVSNGWGWSGSYNTISSLGPYNTPFYTLSSLNPESTDDLKRHNVAFLDTENEFLVIGFEDIQRPRGDNDFNDLLFTVKISPFSAIEGVGPDGSVESDTYEVLVQNDDPDATITYVYPDANSYATLAFEDKWPELGDYDFNDVVWRYRVTEQLNGLRQVKAIDIDYHLQAMGASYSNGFALKLPSVLENDFDSVSLTKNGQPVDYDVKSIEGDDILVITKSVKDDLSELGVLTNSCNYYRTQPECLAQQAENILSYQLSVTLKEPVARESIGYPPYDAFIFATEGRYHGEVAKPHPGMTWQTHLKSFNGTSLMNHALFGMNDDDSGNDAFFLSKEKNMPWAMNIRSQWQHPTENTDISHAYKNFAAWVSSGANNTNWFESPEVNKVIPVTE